VTSGTRKGGDGDGDGNGAGGFDDFFIRDRDDENERPGAAGGYEGHPRGGYDPYEDYAGANAGGRARQPGFDRGLVDSITRIIEGLASVAGDSLAPETRRQLEKALRDLLVVLRDVIDAMISRIDSRRVDDFEIEEIPID
jgi:hypothetical protein